MTKKGTAIKKMICIICIIGKVSLFLYFSIIISNFTIDVILMQGEIDLASFYITIHQGIFPQRFKDKSMLFNKNTEGICQEKTNLYITITGGQYDRAGANILGEEFSTI